MFQHGLDLRDKRVIDLERGIKAAQVNKQRYGENFYREIGTLGGQISRGRGFARNLELAREAGRKGGLASSRKGVRNSRGEFVLKETEL